MKIKRNFPTHWKIVMIAGAITLLATFGIDFSKLNNQDENGTLQKAPEFEISGISGQTINSQDLLGQIVVVNFWATWCAPCREEAPYFEEVWQQYKEDGVIFVGIGKEYNQDKALECIEELGITYFTGFDRKEEIANDFGVFGVPETHIIDRNGDIYFVFRGIVPSPQLEEKIEEALAE
jgi:cytochrome c biogenesis protein CcmG/thiol:disulfide interchange protein DsbE